jgi:hypothetical protein
LGLHGARERDTFYHAKAMGLDRAVSDKCSRSGWRRSNGPGWRLIDFINHYALFGDHKNNYTPSVGKAEVMRR